MKLLSAADRLAAPQKPKILIVGLPGVGKTWLLKTLPDGTLRLTLHLNEEAGGLAVADLPFASICSREWTAQRDIACILGGPNPALPSSAPYSEAHYQAVAADPAMVALTKYQTVVVDSLSEISRQLRVWAEQQPECLTPPGVKDLRAVYGLVAREMIAFLQQIQHDSARTVILIAVLEKGDDGFGSAVWRPQLEGAATGRQLPAIVDEIITMAHLDFGDGKPIRAFVCTNPNPWAFPAKDRSGKLDQLEPPDLGKLLAKLTPLGASHSSQENSS
jgi:hypothetical protein